MLSSSLPRGPEVWEGSHLLVYGDTLIREGDPQGELFALQRRLERARGPELDRVRTRHQALLYERAEHLFGRRVTGFRNFSIEDNRAFPVVTLLYEGEVPLQYAHVRLTFCRGFVRKMVLTGQIDGGKLAEGCRELFASPVMALLREAHVGASHDEPIAAQLLALLDEARPTALRTLTLARGEDASLTQIGEFCSHYSGLKTLSLGQGWEHSDPWPRATPSFSGVTELFAHVNTPGVHALAAALWPRVTCLDVTLDRDAGDASFASLFEPTRFPSLRTLVLRGTRHGRAEAALRDSGLHVRLDTTRWH